MAGHSLIVVVQDVVSNDEIRAPLSTDVRLQPYRLNNQSAISSFGFAGVADPARFDDPPER